MAAASELAILITAQNETTKALRDIQNDLKHTEERADSFGASLKRIQERAAGFIEANVIQRGFSILESNFVASINRASDLNESINKMQVVFGAASNEVERFARTSARSIGLSRQATLEAASSFGAMFNTIHLSRDESARMSTALVQLAADMASFNNEDPSDMLLRLRSGLAGEAEPLRRFGVLLTETRVANEAVRLGLADSTAQVSEAAKVQARYSLILQDSKIQQGDFAATADGLANSQRTLKAVFEDVSASLGKSFTPTVQFAVQQLAALGGDFDTSGVERALLRIQIGLIDLGIRARDSLKEVVGFFDKLNEQNENAKEKVKDFFQGLGINIGGVAKTVLQPAGEGGLLGTGGQLKPVFGPPAPGSIEALRAALQDQLANVGKDMESTGAKTRAAGDAAGEFADTVTEKTTTLGDALSGTLNTIRSAASALEGAPTQEQARLQLRSDQLARDIANWDARARGLRPGERLGNGIEAMQAEKARIDRELADLDAKHKIDRDSLTLADKTLLTEDQREKATADLLVKTKDLTGKMQAAADAAGIHLIPSFDDVMNANLTLRDVLINETIPGHKAANSSLDEFTQKVKDAAGALARALSPTSQPASSSNNPADFALQGI